MLSSNSYNNLSDQELMQQYKATGKSLYLGVLLDRYSLLLFGVCMKYLKDEEEAKDAVQQVFMKAINELQKYKVDFFKSWIYMVARNHCFMQLRNKNQTLPTDWAENNMAADDEDPFLKKETHANSNLLMELTEQGLTQLPEQQNKCVSLFYLSKKSYHQIAESTGYSLLQVKSHIQNGKRNIKLWVEKQLKQQHAS